MGDNRRITVLIRGKATPAGKGIHVDTIPEGDVSPEDRLHTIYELINEIAWETNTKAVNVAKNVSAEIERRRKKRLSKERRDGNDSDE